MRRSLVVLVCVLLNALPVHVQPGPDPVEMLVRRVERVLSNGDKSAFRSLFDPAVSEDDLAQHTYDLFFPGAVRTALFERSRGPLEGVPEGDGFRLVVEFFMETQGRARITTAGIEVRRPRGGGPESWRISAIDSLSALDGLYKLRLVTEAPQTVRNLELRSEDVIIALREGTLFPIESEPGVTGVVLVGDGELRYSPAPTTERGQLRIFAGTDSLASAFDTAYIRFHPSEYTRQVATAQMSNAPPDSRLARRAQDVFNREAPQSYSVDVADMSRDSWFLLPDVSDFLAEVDTNRFDTLTYLRASQQAEDVSLFRREDRKTVTLYPSAAKLAARGRFYSDDTSREYDVLDYAVSADVNPQRQTIRSRARLSLRIRSTVESTLMVRLADSLDVTSVSSVEYGRLLHLRLDGQNMIAVNLPRPLQQDSDLTLVVEYAGRIDSQSLDIDTVQGDAPPPSAQPLQPKYLLSNRSYWYPQNPIADYATASLRLTVPDGYRVVASGEPIEDATPSASAGPPAGAGAGRTFVFRANQPLRYLSFVATRLQQLIERRIAFPDESAGPGGDSMTLAVEANPRLQSRGRAVLQSADDILRFYTGLTGDAPYASVTIAVTESDRPGGHSPAYFSLLNEPLPPVTVTWRGDPAAFDGFPDFFLAHELAHQWWGQAVGWKNYHEQWLSEGFAQYFAALYAQKTRGQRVFVDMLRQFRRWSLEHSAQGPVYLGYRLGHLKSDLRVYRALVYNKGAAVLHMLRQLIGDDAFFHGVRLFYEERRYQKAGTEDLERAMETASGRVLDRFFDRWIYNTDIPRVTFRSTIAEGRVVIEFEQTGSTIVDIPVTVRLVYTNGQTRDVIVVIADRQVMRTIPTERTVREVQINRDFASLAEFEAK